jgi:hypothetical protein
VYNNKDITRSHLVGLDFSSGTFTHAIRFSFLKFQNQIVDSTVGSSLPFADTGVTLDALGNGLYTGPSPLAPQSTPQRNLQIKYDGSKSIRSHILRYGVSFNNIQGGGFASFYGTAPRISWNQTPDNAAFAATGTYAGLNGGGPETNPLNWPAERVRYGNGLGFNTLEPALGFPAGGLGPDHRFAFYVGDSWKVKPNFTLTVGVRYNRDTGRTDSDLPADPAINAQFPGWGNRVKQPNANFAPQLGIAWDPAKNGKTVVRAGIGLYYENVIFNNVLFDRPFRLQTGAFNQTPYGCFSGVPQPLPVAGNTTIAPPASSCGLNVHAGDAIASILTFWDQYKAGNPLDLKAANPNYIGSFLDAGLGVPLGPFAPNYKTPRSVQMNFGIQREIHRGMIFSADYLRNVETRSLLGVDINHVGDVSHFNLGNAQAAIANTLAFCNATSIDLAISNGTCPNGDGTTHTATMVDFADNGLTSDADFGQACGQALGVPCAFGGLNPNQATATFLQPIGRSVYNALQMKLSQNVTTPFRGVRGMNFQISYSLSRFENSGGSAATGTSADNDQDFVLATADNNKPNRYFGPSLLDRTHQISFGGYADLPAKFRVGLVGHFSSPLSTVLAVPNTGSEGEIFRTDFTGDGTVSDPLPGTHFGQFGRSTNASNINALISRYNANVANQATPAGQVLIANNLMTLDQLQKLGGVAPSLPTAPADQANFPWMRSFDMNIAWKFTIKEKVSIEPSVSAFNIFNFSNFNNPPFTMSGLLTGSAGSINGTGTHFDASCGCVPNDTFRVGNGTGTYAVGAGRQIEWGLKVTF